MIPKTLSLVDREICVLEALVMPSGCEEMNGTFGSEFLSYNTPFPYDTIGNHPNVQLWKLTVLKCTTGWIGISIIHKVVEMRAPQLKNLQDSAKN